MAKTDSEAPADDSAPREGEKLQKVLARTGLGSRREMEKWIEQGRVRVGGKVANLGDRVDRRQKIEVDGRNLDFDDGEKTRCLLYHKPTGEVCSRKDPEGRRTVFDTLPRVKAGRWISIGRLDFNTSGLLLFTTDGELANALMHPRANIEREYMVRVLGEVTDDMIQAMLDGVMLDDGMARFTDIQPGGGDGVNRWYYVVLMEGRNREVRRLWESQGLTVSRLKRVRYGELFIPAKIKQGQWLELTGKDVSTLYTMAGLPDRQPLQLKPEEVKKQARRSARRGRVRSPGEKGSKRGSGKAAGKGTKAGRGKAPGRPAARRLGRSEDKKGQAEKGQGAKGPGKKSRGKT